MLTLTPSQQSALHHMLEKRNVFLTGSAGTGKSTLVNHFVETQGHKKVVRIASTGMAAYHINGRTVHSFFSYNPFTNKEESVMNACMNERTLDRIRNLDTLIIDEVSMLHADVFDGIEEIMRFACENDQPWGGKQVIACGDFCQIPPVVKDGEPLPWAFLSKAWAKSDFVMAELTECVRQEDIAFVDILQSVRRGKLDMPTMKFLQSRYAPHLQDDFDGTILFPFNRQVDKLNAQRLLSLPGQLQMVPQHIVVVNKDPTTNAPINEERQQKLLQKMIRDLPADIPLKLKPECLLMVRANNMDEGYVNGTIGHFVDYVPAPVPIDGGEKVDTQAMNDEVEDDGIRIRIVAGRDAGKTITVKRKAYFEYNSHGKAVAKAGIFPVHLAYAITIHKSQGMTCDKLMADLSQPWQSGIMYVAMSRTRTPEGFFVSKMGKNLFLDHEVAKFYGFIS